MDAAFLAKLNSLILRYRDTCLWFMRDDVRPMSPADAIGILRLIEKHGDMEAFIEARQLKEWLSRNTKELSAG
jgi:hypothetical protein